MPASPIEDQKSKMENPFSPLPRDLGYAMPAEWQPHEATWLSWPHHQADWPGKFAPIPWNYAEIVRHIAAGEQVNIFVPGRRTQCVAEDILQRSAVNMARVTLISQPTERVWARDSGPIFLTRRPGGKPNLAPLAVLDWKFNAWARYPDSARDDKLPAVAARRLGVPSWQPMGLNDSGEYQRFVLEGGSIDVNGAGCVLTTEECLLSTKIQPRNPGFSRENIEATFCDYLGVEKVLWLGRGIVGDDTHGHVDDIARFVNATTIVTCVASDRRDVNRPPLEENLRRLRKMRDVRGKPFTIVELPLPAPVFFAGQQLPASYANFYIANAGVLVPVFNEPTDVVALRLLEQCFPGRPMLPVYARDIVWGRGTVHCMTQQQPAVK